MDIRVSMVIASHLSDAGIEMGFDQELAWRRLQFVKVLVSLYPDTSVRVTEAELNTIWSKYVAPQTEEKIS